MESLPAKKQERKTKNIDFYNKQEAISGSIILILSFIFGQQILKYSNHTEQKKLIPQKYSDTNKSNPLRTVFPSSLISTQAKPTQRK